MLNGIKKEARLKRVVDAVVENAESYRGFIEDLIRSQKYTEKELSHIWALTPEESE